MNKDQDLVSGYYNWRDEQEKLNNSIIAEEREDTKNEEIQEKQREIILNMYKDNLPMEDINKYTDLTI